ncbi:MAG TPA: YciI family protein [Vicinamibacteria bacterium]
MMMVKADKDYEAGVPPSPELMAAIGKLGEDAARAGELVEMGGLLPSSKGARIRLAGGKLTVTDGPFSEAKELIGGYAIFQLPSKEEAIQKAKDFLKAHEQVLGPAYTGEIEIRQLFDEPGSPGGER